MTRKEAIKELKILKEDYWDDDGYGHETKQYYDTMLALDMAIEALEQQTCDNCKYSEETDGMNCYECLKGMTDNFEALQQEPKRGEWLDAREEDPCWYICSECKRMVDDDSNYCPNCGARMESDEQ